MKREVDSFLDHLVKEKTQNTVFAYRNDLYQLAEFMENTGIPRQGASMWWSQVDRHLFSSYLLNLKDKAYAPSTVTRKTAASKSFFNFLLKRGKIDRSPAENLASSGIKKTAPQTMSVLEVRRLLAQPAKLTSPEGLRDRAMLELLYAGGLRVGELVSLNCEHVDLGKGSVRCLGRRNRERKVPIPEHVTRILREYVNEARPEFLEHDGELALFVNRRGGRLTRQGVWQILKDYARTAGLKANITPHTLRHSLAAHLLSSGASARSVQELLGHANSSMIHTYAQLVVSYPAQ